MGRRRTKVRPSIFESLSIPNVSNKEGRKKEKDAFDEDGNFKSDLPTSMSASIDDEGLPTLLGTADKNPGMNSRTDVATKEEGPPSNASSSTSPADPTSNQVSEFPFHAPPSIVIPSAGITLSPKPMEHDMAPGTSTEEEFIEGEIESELLAEERRESALRRKKKKAMSVGSGSSAGPAVAVRRNRWWALVGMGRTKSLLWIFLRWPLLITFVIFMSVDLTCYIAVRQWVRWYEWAITWRGKRRLLRQDLNNATNYEMYKGAARKLDEFLGNGEWKTDEPCAYYDVDLVHRTVRRLRRHRQTITNALKRAGPKDSAVDNATRAVATRDIMKILQHGASKHNFGGVENEALYSHTYLGTKKLVEEYYTEVCSSLETLAESKDLTPDEKYDFFKKTAHNYGRTALCLSGGASLGYYHVGVVKALFEEKMLPTIITGTSAGSLIAAIICCRTDEELESEVFVPSIHKLLTACDVTYWERFKRMYRTGAMFDHREWYQKMILATKGPLTFLEAYQRTGRVLNVAIVPDEPHSPFKLCNYITTPHVVVATAVMASSAVPGILNPVELLMKLENSDQLVPFHGSGRKWRDGSLMMDIPERELHRLWNVNFTIVSQVNPHIVLFFFDRRGSPGSPTAHRHGEGWRGGFIASALVHHFKLDLQKWMSLLKDFELLPRVLGTDVSDVFLQRFEGSVTIVPRPTLLDYKMILTDPTNERMQNYINRGEARAWPKLHMIRNRMSVEKTLARCRKVASDAGGGNGSNGGGGEKLHRNSVGSLYGEQRGGPPSTTTTMTGAQSKAMARRSNRYSNAWNAASQRSPRWISEMDLLSPSLTEETDRTVDAMEVDRKEDADDDDDEEGGGDVEEDDEEEGSVTAESLVATAVGALNGVVGTT
ncbi:hypothetical protein HKX48_003796 [Thoreauomyces humboldtii]|nr:hypothetical protein HKX48_003796 [Thoreauomyces humboldtii]